MIFSTKEQKSINISRSDVNHPLASWSRHEFELDGCVWPSLEHYFHGMKFNDQEMRQQLCEIAHPKDIESFVKKHKRDVRKDWDAIKVTIMTRGFYIKCRTHADVKTALMATGDNKILETSQYDYYWGCGRDLRGKNMYGEVLMNVREKLQEEDAA